MSDEDFDRSSVVSRVGVPMTGAAYDPVKRASTSSVAAIGLVVTAPMQAVIALLVRRKLGSPVLFRQERPGKDEQIFELVKFRTMLDPRPRGGTDADADRMTSFGSFLRSTSLDELPDAVERGRGDMSLVGPRPLLVRYLDRYSPNNDVATTCDPASQVWRR